MHTKINVSMPFGWELNQDVKTYTIVRLVIMVAEEFLFVMSGRTILSNFRLGLQKMDIRIN